jgi:hypothetical protein
MSAWGQAILMQADYNNHRRPASRKLCNQLRYYLAEAGGGSGINYIWFWLQLCD